MTRSTTEFAGFDFLPQATTIKVKQPQAITSYYKQPQADHKQPTNNYKQSPKQ